MRQRGVGYVAGQDGGYGGGFGVGGYWWAWVSMLRAVHRELGKECMEVGGTHGGHYRPVGLAESGAHVDEG